MESSSSQSNDTLGAPLAEDPVARDSAASDSQSAETIVVPVWRRWVVWILRLLAGATFVMSGFVKLVDPWGFIYKIEQYLAVWTVDVPRSLTIVGAISLSGFELLMGVSLLLGIFRRGAVWLSGLFMVAMTLLTAYIVVADPVSDCGCFGDFIILSNWATFAKNVVLLAAIAYLLRYNRHVSGVYHPACQWLVAAVVGFYALIVALTGYNFQPVIDFRPYPVGSTLVADDTDDEADSMVFVYEKDGKRQEFSADALPDSTWRYVERRQEPKASASESQSIAIFDGDEDVTAEVLTPEGTRMLMLIPDMRYADITYTYLINEMNRELTEHGGELVAVIATDSDGVELWRDLSMAEYPVYTADDTAIKEIARGNISLVYIVDGVIKWKRNIWSVPMEILDDQTLLDHFAGLAVRQDRKLETLTASCLAALLVLWLTQTFARTVYSYIFVRRKRGGGESADTESPEVDVSSEREATDEPVGNVGEND